MVKITEYLNLQTLPGWRVTHQSEQVTTAISGNGAYRLLMAEVSVEGPRRLSHINDGRITCFITGFQRPETLDNGLSGQPVTGYLNFRPMEGYLLMDGGRTPARIALLTRADGKRAPKELRRQALEVARKMAEWSVDR